VKKAGYYARKLGFLFVIAVFVCVYYISSRKILQPKALYFPNFLLILMAVLIVWNVIGTLIEAGKEIKAGKANLDFRFPEFLKKHQKKIIVFVSTLALVLLARYVGFWVMATLYIFVIMRVLGLKKLWLNILLTAVLIAVFYLVFCVLLKVRFPSGILI